MPIFKRRSGNLSLLLAIAVSLGLTGSHAAAGERLRIGLLPYESCLDASVNDDMVERNQRYWYPGSSRAVGGEGGCYLGFPSARDAWAEILINDDIVRVFPSSSYGRYRSKDGRTLVEIRVTKSGTTCVPNDDKCCGDYLRGTLTVKSMGKSARVRVANYVGG